MLTNPENVSRIRDPHGKYREQPDLDIYARAFDDMGLSQAFAGSDVDALFGVVLRQPLHGMWEREGSILIQEHKTHAPAMLNKQSGQFRALTAFAGINPEKLHVIFTFGPAHNPAEQTWQYLFATGRLSRVQAFTADVEQWPHRKWIRMVMGKSHALERHG